MKHPLSLLLLAIGLLPWGAPAQGGELALLSTSAPGENASLTVPVLKSPLNPGQIIQADDVEWVSLAYHRVSQNTLTSLDQMVGMQTRRALPAGRPLRNGDVQKSMMISKGATVAVNITTPALSLSMVGRAMESGAEGEIIQILNPQSKKIITGTVVGHNEVQIRLPGVFHAAR